MQNIYSKPYTQTTTWKRNREYLDICENGVILRREWCHILKTKLNGKMDWKTESSMHKIILLVVSADDI